LVSFHWLLRSFACAKPCHCRRPPKTTHLVPSDVEAARPRLPGPRRPKLGMTSSHTQTVALRWHAARFSAHMSSQ
jgi:hypothetical protein